jgi:hypothetical protein
MSPCHARLPTAPPAPARTLAEKPGFSTWEGEFPRDTDSLLCFELSVPVTGTQLVRFRPPHLRIGRQPCRPGGLVRAWTWPSDRNIVATTDQEYRQGEGERDGKVFSI